jgi:hypothetical protein
LHATSGGPRRWRAAPPPAQDYREKLQVAADHAQAGRLAQARRLLDFLGVGWDESVLEFHTKARTAVSQKIYERSAGRWRNYEDQVQRVSGNLARFITAFGYD